MKNKVLVFRIIFTVALALVLYYFLLPPINLTSPLFWFYALVVFGFYLFSGIAKIAKIKDVITKKTTIKKQQYFKGTWYHVKDIRLIGGIWNI